VVNQKDDHKGLGLRPRFLRYLFANIILALRAPGSLSCGKQQPISGTAIPPRFYITDVRYVAAQNAGLFLKTPKNRPA
jgi:hypothetical protein